MSDTKNARFGDVQRACQSFISKPTHAANALIALFGVFGTVSVLSAAKALQSGGDEVSGFINAFGLFLSATCLHFLLFYHSLIEIEEGRVGRGNNGKADSTWLDNWGDKTIRYVGVFLLLAFAGKSGIEKLLSVPSVFYAWLAAGSFLLFTIWSIFYLLLRRDKTKTDLNVLGYLTCDALALACWIFLALFISTESLLWLSLFNVLVWIYGIALFILRFGLGQAFLRMHSSDGATDIVKEESARVVYSLLILFLLFITLAFGGTRLAHFFEDVEAKKIEANCPKVPPL